ncbi:MAG: synthetase [Hyphomicrobiales bacterium]|nr:synthetase [Hyphomicrobiales bacterium]
MATETPNQILDKANAAAKLAREAADMLQSSADQFSDTAGAFAHAASGGAIDPFVFRLAIFALAICVGYYVVWSVTPALHTPLMSVTNAISSVIVVGALLSVGVDAGAPGDDGPLWAKLFGFIALILASVNIFGGFLVTERMLSMYKKKG